MLYGDDIMESQEYIYCSETNKKCKKNNCLAIVAIILGLLFTFVLGSIIGAALADLILLELAAIIILAVVLFILLIITLILLSCKVQKRYCNK